MLAKLTPNTQIIGQNLIYFNQISSSNDFAQQLIQDLQAIHGTLIICDYQTLGRGQGQHRWESEAGKNLLCTLILLPKIQIADPFILNKALAVALLETLAPFLDAEQLKIKWPNDLYYNHKKLGGLLVENTFQGQNIKSSVMGFGINTHQIFSHTSLNAVSLSEIATKPFSHKDLIESFLMRFEQLYGLIENKQQQSITQSFDQHLLGYLSDQNFQMQGSIIHATLMGCDEHGRLILQNNLGQQTVYLHGQISQIIP